MSSELKYLGHSAFYIKTENHGILIDPFITQNPQATFDTSLDIVTDIIVTHGHNDHLGDAIPISRSSQAEIIAVFELANYCNAQGARALPVGLGGEIKREWGSVWFLPAFHSSSLPDGRYAGCPASVLLDIDGVKIFHAGDTAVNKEMELVGDLYKPYYALLPIGGHFTMGIKEAAVAARLLKAKEIIPMHYNTFDVIQAETLEFEMLIESQKQKCLPIRPGESITF